MRRYREYPGPNLDRMFDRERYDLENACNILFYDWRSASMKWINPIMAQCDSQQRATRATYGRWNANQQRPAQTNGNDMGRELGALPLPTSLLTYTRQVWERLRAYLWRATA